MNAARATEDDDHDADPAPALRLHERVVSFVTFADEHDRRPVPRTARLTEALPRHVARPGKSGPAVSFVVYAPGADRGNDGVRELTMVVFDFDHLAADAARQVIRELRGRGWAHLVYSSFSHRLRGDDDICFRVVLPVCRPVLPHEHAALWASVNRDLGGLADRKARDLARLWFIPACAAERLAQAVYEIREGFALDVDAMLARQPPTPAAPAPPRRPVMPIAARAVVARRVAQARLNNDPAIRERAALRLDAQLTETKATRIACPMCGRPSVWFWLDPQRRRTASCNHVNSCGWWGFLDTLLDLAGGSDGA